MPTPSDGTLNATIRTVAARLAAAGVPSPDADALALVAFAAGSEPAVVRTAAARGDAPLAAIDAVALEALVARREQREPLQHILGRAPFRKLELAVGPGVFVPRPETELVAGAAIEAARLAAAGVVRPRVADLCTGTGAIALAVATEADARVWAVELSRDAFAFLERNVAAHAAVAGRVIAVQGDARTALTELDGTLDVVVSNPPYIPGDARPSEVEVAKHDPAVALYGLGGDGLEVPRGITAAAARLLRPGGVFVMEHGAPQAEAVRELVAATGAFADIETSPDLAGFDRFVRALRRGDS